MKFEMIIDMNLKFVLLEQFEDNRIQRVGRKISSSVGEAYVAETLAK
jgi:hypothetical protein